MRRTVTLVSNVEDRALATYLTDIGFVVHQVDTPAHARKSGALVWLKPAVDEWAIADAIRTWLGTAPGVRVIVVSDRPARVRSAARDPRGRVQVLPAPAFGWQLVDALRDDSGITP
jgi:hypothetical protein